MIEKNKIKQVAERLNKIIEKFDNKKTSIKNNVINTILTEYIFSQVDSLKALSYYLERLSE